MEVSSGVARAGGGWVRRIAGKWLAELGLWVGEFCWLGGDWGVGHPFLTVGVLKATGWY